MQVLDLDNTLFWSFQAWKSNQIGVHQSYNPGIFIFTALHTKKGCNREPFLEKYDLSLILVHLPLLKMCASSP